MMLEQQNQQNRDWLPSPNWFERFRWSAGPDEAPTETAQGKIAFVGLAGAGKKTLMNTIWGWQAVPESPETTRNFGVFTLINLPTSPYDNASVMYRLEQVELILYVVDLSRGLQPDDFNWIARLRALETTFVLVANKADLVEKGALDKLLASIQERAARPVIPVSGQDTDSVHAHFVPKLLQTCPDLAVPLATEIAWLRRKVARHLVMRSVIASMTLSLETDPVADSSNLLNMQLRLVKRIAALHGHKERGLRRREMIVSTALRFYLRTVIKLAARFPQVRSWMMSGALAAGSTAVVGWLAMAYYEGRVPDKISRMFSIRGG